MIFPTYPTSQPFGWHLTTVQSFTTTTTYVEVASGSTSTSTVTQLVTIETLGVSEDGFLQGNELVPILASVAPSVTSLDRSIETKLYEDLRRLYDSYYSTAVPEQSVFEADLASTLHTSYIGDLLASIYNNPSSGVNYISTAFPYLLSEAQAAVSAVSNQGAKYESAQASLVLSDLALVNTTGALPSMTYATSMPNANPTANIGASRGLKLSSAAVILIAAFMIVA